MKKKHTAKSVGFATAFAKPASPESNQWNSQEGMTYAEWLYGQNVAALAGQHISYNSEHSTAEDTIASTAKDRTMRQLEAVANMLNELEEMEG